MENSISKRKISIPAIVVVVFLALMLFNAYQTRQRLLGIREEAVAAMEAGDYEAAIALLEPIGAWEDAPELVVEARRAAYDFSGVCPHCGYSEEMEVSDGQ